MQTQLILSGVSCNFILLSFIPFSSINKILMIIVGYMGQILYLDHISIFLFLNVGKLWPDSTENLCLSSLQTKTFHSPDVR